MQPFTIICVECGRRITVQADTWEDAGDYANTNYNWDSSTDTPLCPPCADAFWGVDDPPPANPK